MTVIHKSWNISHDSLLFQHHLYNLTGKSRPSVYISPKYGGTSFTVAHYAGNISYSLSGILKTNKNVLKPALSFVMRGS